MANPQPDKFIRISVEFFEALLRTRIAGEERQVFDTIIRKTWGYGKKSDIISNSQFCKHTRLNKSSVCRAINKLINKNMVDKKVNKNTSSYSIQKDFDKWKSLTKKSTVDKKVNNCLQKSKLVLTKKRHTKDNNTKDNKYSENSNEFALSKLLLDLILKRKPNFKKPNLQKWAKNIDLMIRNDKRNIITIRRVIKWCQQDEFWQNNILSTGKLRRQFDQLELKMDKDGFISTEELPQGGFDL